LVVIRQTSWPLLVESRRTPRRTGFLPYLLRELALRRSFSVVRRIGTVPSGHASPVACHACTTTSPTLLLPLLLPRVKLQFLGLSGGS
jgi:hypothetical protein